MWLSSYFVSVNIVSFVCASVDKIQAKRRRWRVSEASLVLLSVLGGYFGLCAAFVAFNHKLRKRAFLAQVLGAVVVRVVVFHYVFGQ